MSCFLWIRFHTVLKIGKLKKNNQRNIFLFHLLEFESYGVLIECGLAPLHLVFLCEYFFTLYQKSRGELKNS